MKIVPELELVLSPHGDLKRRAGDRILVLPERAIRIGGSGAEILEILHVPCSVEDLIATLQSRYPEAPEIEASVMEFLREMVEMGGIVPRESLAAMKPSAGSDESPS